MKKFKAIVAAVLTLTLAAAGTFPAFAAKKDYKIYNAWWEIKNDGSLIACWDKPSKKSAYHVRLYKNEYKMVTGWITDNGVQYFLNDGSNSTFPAGAWVH